MGMSLLVLVNTRIGAQEFVGGVRGVIYDAEFGGTVPAATVRISETGDQAETGGDGNFVFPNVPAGSYTLIVSKSGYERLTSMSVVVTPGGLVDLVFRLKGEFVELEEYVVRDLKLDDSATTVGVLKEREASIAFTDAVSSDAMKQAGASDAAGALKMVAGASVADGKYATVRGLSDRYVGTSMNQVRVPSSDPKRRGVQIDIFPAATIKNMSVYKTFTPDVPADWSGGGLDIATLGIPDKSFVDISFSRGFNSQYSGKDGFLTYEGAGISAWGRHAGARDIPAESYTPPDDLDSEFVELADEAHPHDEEYLKAHASTRAFAPAMGTTHARMPEDFGVKVTMGGKSDLGDGWTMGGTTALSYDRKHSRRESFEQRVEFETSSDPTLRTDARYVTEQGAEELKLGMLGAFGLCKTDRHKLTLTLLRNRTTSDEAEYTVLTGGDGYLLHPDGAETVSYFGEGDSYHTQDHSIQYAERTVDSLQLHGEHTWDELVSEKLGFKVDWFGAHNIAEQEEPDMRKFKNYVYTGTNDAGEIEYESIIGEKDVPKSAPLDLLRIWRNTSEDNTQLGLNITVPFRKGVLNPAGLIAPAGSGVDAWTDKEGKVQVGLLRDFTQRRYTQQSFTYAFAGRDTTAAYPPGIPSSLPGYPPWWDYYKIKDGQPVALGHNPIPIKPADQWWWKLKTAPVAQQQAWVADAAEIWEQTHPEGIRYATTQEAIETHAGGKSFVTTDPDTLWTDVFSDPSNFQLGPYRNQLGWYLKGIPGDAFKDVEYTGVQNLNAGYWLVDLPLTKQLKLIGGARLEVTDITIQPISPPPILIPVFATETSFNDDGKEESYITSPYMDSTDQDGARAEIEDADWYRSAGIVFEALPGMNFRYNWSQTMARPTYRELSPVVFLDFFEDEAFIGNSDLKLVQLVNRDFRWEWFPKPGDVFAVSWFSKEMRDPIEFWEFEYNNVDYTTVLNFPEGRLDGWEFEARKTFARPLGLPGKLTVGLNYTMMDAQVRMYYGHASELEDSRIIWIPRQKEITPVIERLVAEGKIDPDAEIAEETDGDSDKSMYYDEERGWPLSLDVWRTMVDQPAYLYNINLIYDIDKTGTQFGLFVNGSGDVLRKGPSFGASKSFPGYYLDAEPSLDIAVSQKLGDHWKWTFRIRGANEPKTQEIYRFVDFENDGELVEMVRREYRTYVSYSFGLSGSW